MERSFERSKLAGALAALALLAAATARVSAHPGSSIAVDAHKQVYFVDTGQGVWKIDTQGKLSLIHTLAYHWMALDEKGHFAKSNSLGDFDGGSFERVTPVGAIPTVIISSDYPIAVGPDGGLYYVPYKPEGLRELVRRMPDGARTVITTLPTETGEKAAHWVNGIAVGPDGLLYFTDNDAVRRLEPNGGLTTVRESISAPDCSGDPDLAVPKLPYLRGLALGPDGTIYAAANGCRTVIAIPRKGTIRTILRAERPWSPTGVALSGGDIYVLEYLHTPGENRREWVPRVRKIGGDGRITTLATVSR